jgi:hypothetical protein
MAKFNIEAHLHRFSGTVRRVAWIRYYARIETAVRRCSEFLVVEGEVGDIIEFTLKINGYQVGTIQLKATGKINVLWNDTEAKKLQNKHLLEMSQKEQTKNKTKGVKKVVHIPPIEIPTVSLH